MSRRLASLLLSAVALACATPPPPTPEPVAAASVARPPPPKPMLPLAVQVVPSRLDATSSLNRAAERAIANGFKMRLPAFLEPGYDAPLSGLDTDQRALAVSDISGVYDGTISQARCRGRVEVIYLASTPGRPGSFLRVSCHAEVLSWSADGCTRHPEIGCPEGGDKVVGEIALDSASNL